MGKIAVKNSPYEWGPTVWSMNNPYPPFTQNSPNLIHKEKQFTSGEMFDHVKGAGEIEDVDGRDVPRVHLDELHAVRHALPRIGEPRGVQFGADQALPATRSGQGAQHRPGTAADLDEAAGLRKELVGQARDQLAAGNEPEVPGFDPGKHLKALGIDAADGVGEARREHRNAAILRDRRAASGTAPSERPQRRLVSHRLDRAAGKAAPAR